MRLSWIRLVMTAVIGAWIAPGAAPGLAAGADPGANEPGAHGPGPGRAASGNRPGAGRSDAVVVNGERLSVEVLDVLAAEFGAVIPPGNYWHDPYCGAWGLAGGPTLGFTLAGIEVGGELAEDASGGGTGVFVNGRELHPLDVKALLQWTPVYPGRYWLDARGIGGYEGGPAVFNLAALCAPRRPYKSKLLDYGSVIAGEGIIGFVDSEGRSFHSGP